MELYIPPINTYRNPLNGRYVKGHVPHNKGKKWDDYLSKEAQENIRKNAFKNVKKRNTDVKWLKIAVVGIDKDGNRVWFESSADAQRKLGVTAENIMKCYKKKRKTAGGYRWFRFDDDEWIKLVNKEE